MAVYGRQELCEADLNGMVFVAPFITWWGCGGLMISERVVAMLHRAAHLEDCRGERPA